MGGQEVAGAQSSEFCLLKLCAILPNAVESGLHSRAEAVSALRAETWHQPLTSRMIRNTLSSSAQRSHRRVWHLVQEREVLGLGICRQFTPTAYKGLGRFLLQLS